MARLTQPNPFSRGGNAAIEFALLAPVLLTLLTGIAELGMAGYQAMQVQAAVAAGVIYAAGNGWTNTGAINTAVTSATGTAGITASTSSPFYGCGGSGVIVTQASSTAACPDGYAPGTYVTISAAVPHQTIMPYLNLNLPASYTATTTIRVQ
jgi:Flp pilus assembly protein TadG